MSSNTWTQRAVESEARRARRRLWRAVEAQHIASTLRLVASVEEQLLLERLLEQSKPPLPPEAGGLHYLLATPFRYSSPIGSRFRAAADSGIWYGAEAQRTACAELGYWRWRFLTDSAALEALGPSPQTVFRAGIDALWVDLTEAPFKRAHAQWAHPNDYGPTQDFARRGAPSRISTRSAMNRCAIRSTARRWRCCGPCFKPRRLLEQHTWFLTVRREAVIWQREGETFEFDARAWSR